jgi:outer membrane lipoprotein SlyB
MKKPFYKLHALMLAALLAAASAGAIAGDGYGSHDLGGDQARQTLKVRRGVVIDVQTVELKIEAGGTTKAVGGVVGALAGATATQGQQNWQTQGLGSAVGAVLGMAAADKLGSSKKEAVQVVVQLDSGDAVALAQTMENPLTVGQRVFFDWRG